MRIELRHICPDRAKYVADIGSFRRINAISFKLCGMLVDNLKLVLRHFGANCVIIAALGYNFKTTCGIVTKLGKWMICSLPKRYAPLSPQLRRNCRTCL